MLVTKWIHNQEVQTSGENRPSRASRLRRRLSAFHKGEEGLEAVETVIIIFVGVLILLAVVNFFFPQVWTKLKAAINDLLKSRS